MSISRAPAGVGLIESTVQSTDRFDYNYLVYMLTSFSGSSLKGSEIPYILTMNS